MEATACHSDEGSAAFGSFDRAAVDAVALVGIRNKQELQENVAAADWRLTDEIRCEIDRVSEEEGVPMYVGAEQAA